MLGARPPGERIRVFGRVFGQRQQQAAFGAEPLRQRARHQSDLVGNGGQGQAHRPDPADQDLARRIAASSIPRGRPAVIAPQLINVFIY